MKSLIDDGDKLLKDLLSRSVPVRAAVWFNDPEKEAWKLVVVTPVASNPGPLEAYMQIQAAMSRSKLSFALDDVVVMSPESAKFEEFRRTLEGVARIPLLDPKGSQQNTAFDDAYIYRW